MLSEKDKSGQSVPGVFCCPHTKGDQVQFSQKEKIGSLSIIDRRFPDNYSAYVDHSRTVAYHDHEQIKLPRPLGLQACQEILRDNLCW